MAVVGAWRDWFAIFVLICLPRIHCILGTVEHTKPRWLAPKNHPKMVEPSKVCEILVFLSTGKTMESPLAIYIFPSKAERQWSPSSFLWWTMLLKRMMCGPQILYRQCQKLVDGWIFMQQGVDIQQYPTYIQWLMVSVRVCLHNVRFIAARLRPPGTWAEGFEMKSMKRQAIVSGFPNFGVSVGHHWLG